MEGRSGSQATGGRGRSPRTKWDLNTSDATRQPYRSKPRWRRLRFR